MTIQESDIADWRGEKPWLTTEKARAIAMWNAGERPDHIGMKLGRTGLAISKYMDTLRKKGVDVEYRVALWSAEDEETAAQMWNSGEPLAAIAAKIGRTVPSVKTRIEVMRRRGVALDTRLSKPTYSVDDVIERWQRGETSYRISAALKIPRGTVCKLVWCLRRAGTTDSNGQPLRRGR